jgi:hypothetical protein
MAAANIQTYKIVWRSGRYFSCVGGVVHFLMCKFFIRIHLLNFSFYFNAVSKPAAATIAAIVPRPACTMAFRHHD